MRQTDCTRKQMDFQRLGRREVVARFDGGRISSDAGGLLVRECERATGIVRRFAQCFRDYRAPERIEHPLEQLLGQRVFALALGYEDLNDHDALRGDPLLATLVGRLDADGRDRVRERDRGKPLAGKSTLNRLELTSAQANRTERYKKIEVRSEAVEALLVELFLDAYPTPPEEIVLDLDATDDPVHGAQEGRFFHGYYGCYCYLPLYIVCGDHVLVSKLRTSDRDPSDGALEELARVVGAIRSRWPQVRILVRGDSGFCRDPIMGWCEAQGLDYVFGLARNARLEKMAGAAQEEARRLHATSGRAARVFTEFEYETLQTWSRKRRVIAKAEHLAMGPNPRFVVTTLRGDGQEVYERTYCARGGMENRIKEHQLWLFADRTSAGTMRANQLRLWMSSMAYALIQALRRLALAGTEMATAQACTIRVKLLKIGARVRVTARRVWISLSESCPAQALFIRAYENLHACAPLRC